MAEVVLETGINPDDPEEWVLALVIDPEGSDAERTLVAIGDLCHPDENGVYAVPQSDAYAAPRLADGVLTVDVVTFPEVLEGLRVTTAFPLHDEESVRLLRVVGETGHDTLPPTTHVFTTPIEALTDNEDETPFVLARPPVTGDATSRA
ncbi:hypothetical protein [Actinophytocola oryzae]|uniref:Uncharacterized protein n=1 Tax=Actinophytocola oryzae TaxID=502181 RepID=A0A4R7VXT8_9PSEU|nr:hypothetical protein [Actinophytocola oryzae]TDV54976.1 hypothetical protein CLV71_103217 [Actinophytocola oryzae]